MKKCLLLMCCLVVATLSYAEAIPTSYYASCQGLKDKALKTALSTVVNKGNRIAYGNDQYHTTTRIAGQDTMYNGVLYHKGDTMWHQGDFKSYGSWHFFPVIDRRPDGSIWDMYSNTHRYYPLTAGESGCNLQIEHCMPKSWWGGPGQAPKIEADSAWHDLFNLSPSDDGANNNKSNYPPGFVNKGDKFDNGSFRMDSKNASSYGYICFEPADCYKGDFARTYFYMVTAYQHKNWHGESASTQSLVDKILNNDSYLEFRDTIMQVLLEWHRMDPVSQKEIERQDAISSIQHNRNPYIDYPELIEYIWGDKKGQTVDFSSLVCTSDAKYQPLPENTQFEAYTATDIQSDYFVANWNGFFEGDYKVEVYSDRKTVGQNDTLLCFRELNKYAFNSTPNCEADEFIQSVGTQSICMGSGSNDGSLSIYKLNLTEPAILRFRGCKVATVGSTGQLNIYLDGHTAPDTIIDDFRNDEMMYSYVLPTGTKKVKLLSYGQSTRKRVCMQELYIIRGDLHEEYTYVKGFPTMFSKQRHAYGDTVHMPIHVPNAPGQQLYYRVTAAGDWVSKEIPVTLGSSQKLFQVITTVKEGTHGTATGGGQFVYGSQITLTATPAAHNHFVQWNDSDINPSRLITVYQDTLFEAEFAEDTFSVTVLSENGTVTGAGYYKYDSTATLTVTPKAGWLFQQWNDGNTDNPRAIVVRQDTTLTALYEKDTAVVFLTVNYTLGTVKVDGTKLNSGDSLFYTRGTEVKLEASNPTGYIFKMWSDSVTNAKYTLVLSQDTTLSTSYNPRNYAVSVSVEGKGTATGAGTYPYGSTVILTVTPDEGYEFIKWSDGNTDNPREIIVNTTSKNKYTAICTDDTGWEDISVTTSSVQKIVIDGQLYIIRGKHLYNALGKRLR